jgi:signal transduction histidine kinase
VKAEPKMSKGDRLTIWMFLQSFVIIIASVASFMMIEYVAYLKGSIISFDILRSIGMILPMCAILGALNYHFLRFMYRSVSTLTEAIASFANGDFNTRLTIKDSGPLGAVYANFNTLGAELQKTQMLRNDFINSFSHEFKTPLTAINGFAKLLLETDLNEADKTQYLKIIADESARLAEFANSAMLLSKLDSQAIIPDKRQYRLDEQLRRCVILLQTDWERKKITFQGAIPPINYRGNPEMMQHIWLNLLSNAIKFTPEHGEITVSAQESDTMIQVRIADTGNGMAEEILEHIFDKYYQHDTAHSRGGLGLGLTIVKRIVDLCGGSISVASTVDEGSTFTVTLPASRRINP